mgnify:CR=1 FL=1
MPSTKGLYCWWCCHTIPNHILNMPYHFNEKDKSYKVYGNFCTWSCMKAYNNYDSDYQKHNRSSLITMMYYDIHKHVKNITMAPPRQKLKSFGGNMDIDEFRNCKTEYILSMPPLNHIQHTIDKNQNNNFKFINKDEAKQNFKSSSKVKINPIKIKSSNTGQNSSLHSVLGILHQG